MRVMLRNKKTGLYCAAANEWTGAIGQALDFLSVPHAARFARDGNLPELEAVVKCDSLPDQVAVPLVPGWCDFDHPDSVSA
jgi:hypothetical protein